jgi:hypothetical protein
MPKASSPHLDHHAASGLGWNLLQFPGHRRAALRHSPERLNFHCHAAAALVRRIATCIP